MAIPVRQTILALVAKLFPAVGRGIMGCVRKTAEALFLKLGRAIFQSYHLGMARDPSDLPDWLFDEVSSVIIQPTSRTRYRPLRDIYNFAAEEQMLSSSTSPRPKIESL
jgi:hypothetical protein